MKPGKLISQRIRSLREAAGLSQQDVAVRADLSVSMVAKLEQGKKADPRASTLLALAAALDVRPGELLDGLRPPVAPAAVAAPVEEAANDDAAANGKKKKKKKGDKKKAK